MPVKPDLRSPNEEPLSATVVLVGTLAWMVTVGTVLYAARAPIARWLDGLVPETAPEIVEPVAEPSAPPPPASPPAAPPPAPLSEAEVADRLAGLPEGVLGLVAEARDEVGSFEGLGSRDPVRAQVMANRWQKWGVVWRNRVGRLAEALPPTADCDRYPAQVEPCRFATEAVDALRGVADQSTVDAARDALDRLEQDVETFLAPPEEPTEASEEPTEASDEPAP